MRRTAVVLDDPLSEQEIAERGRTEQLETVQTREDVPREGRPCDDGCEDPDQFPEWRPSVFEVVGKLHGLRPGPH